MTFTIVQSQYRLNKTYKKLSSTFSSIHEPPSYIITTAVVTQLLSSMRMTGWWTWKMRARYDVSWNRRIQRTTLKFREEDSQIRRLRQPLTTYHYHHRHLERKNISKYWRQMMQSQRLEMSASLWAGVVSVYAPGHSGRPSGIDAALASWCRRPLVILLASMRLIEWFTKLLNVPNRAPQTDTSL